MEIFLHRTHRSDTSTCGELYIGGTGARQCFTLEPPIRAEKPRAIPPGRYRITMRWSARHQEPVPGLHDVPDFTDIEIHVGNSAKDTEGCILVGQDRAADFVGHSRVAFKALMQEIEAGIASDGECWITILGAETEFKT